MPDRFHASYEESTHEDHCEYQWSILKNADHAFVACKEPRNRSGGGCVDAEKIARHIPGRAQGSRERHVNAVIVERGEVESCESTAREARGVVVASIEERFERVVKAFCL